MSHRSINTEFLTIDRVDEAFSLICMMFRYILPGPGLLVYMSTLLSYEFSFPEKGKWQDNRNVVHPEMTLSSPTFDVLHFEKPWLVYRLEEE